MKTTLKAAMLGIAGIMTALPLFAAHAETLQEVTDQGNSTTNSVTVGAFTVNGSQGVGDFGGFQTMAEITSPSSDYWNVVFQNSNANTLHPTSTAQWGQYVTDDGDLQLWSIGPSVSAHEFLTFVTPEQEIAFGTNGPGGVYFPEPGLVFAPFASNTNDLGLPNAAWRSLYVGGMNFTSATGTALTTTDMFATNGSVGTLQSGTMEVSGPASFGSFGGFPTKFAITAPNGNVWTSIEQNATALSAHPNVAEPWGSFVANDGSYSVYAVSSSQGFMQLITQAQMDEAGIPGLGGVYVGPDGGTLSPWSNNDIDLGLPSDSWKDVYVSGTIYTVGLDATGQVRLSSDAMVGGKLICLADGTNCPASAQSNVVTPPGYVNNDIDGQAKILQGDTEVQVTISNIYAAYPNVLVTPREFIDGAYRVTNVTKNSFVIQFSKPQNKDVLLDWRTSAIEFKSVTTSKKK